MIHPLPYVVNFDLKLEIFNQEVSVKCQRIYGLPEHCTCTPWTLLMDSVESLDNNL